MKGVSIPINTLIMLAVAIIVLLAAVAWFMGAFTGTSTDQVYRQRFQNSCSQWVGSNCAQNGDGVDEVPDNICNAYNEWSGNSGNCDHELVAQACGCAEPFGTR